MIIDLEHRTAYRYDQPVQLDPHTVRFIPRSDPSQRPLQFQLRVAPETSRRADGVDLWGNPFTQLWFQEETDRLEIASSARVETLRKNPFDYLLEQNATKVPLTYPAPLAASVAPYLVQGPAPPPVASLALELASAAGHDTVGFLTRLTAEFHRTHRQIVRLDGPPLAPEVTLAQRQGACRDLAVVFMAAARHVGVACRFVSGYHVTQGENRGDELHAWVETYLPGAGWRGYDPTTGLAVGDRHIAVAAAPTPEAAMPVAGTYRGLVGAASMEVHVSVRSVERATSARGSS